MPGKNCIIELTSNWTNPRTIDIAQKSLESPSGAGYNEKHPDNEDLRWVQRDVWGKLGY
jgi:hypothetical protein